MEYSPVAQSCAIEESGVVVFVAASADSSFYMVGMIFIGVQVENGVSYYCLHMRVCMDNKRN